MHDEKINDIFNHCTGNSMHRQRISGFIIQGTGTKRRKKSKRSCKMHNWYRQGFQSNLFLASLCQMYGHRHEQALQRLATMARFAQSIKNIFRLEGCGIRMLSRQRPAINKQYHPRHRRDFLIPLLWRGRTGACRWGGLLKSLVGGKIKNYRHTGAGRYPLCSANSIICAMKH